MLRSEFESLTGIYVDLAMYAAIEQEYMRSDKGKVTFCEDYKANKDGMAEKIRQSVDLVSMKEMDAFEEKGRDFKRLIAVQSARIMELTDKLMKEEEWQRVPNSNMEIVSYQKLFKCGRRMTDGEAVRLIAENFGFDPDAVQVKDTIPVIEKNRHGKVRQVMTEERPPVYDASDYNYIRFNVLTKPAVFHWEMVNGELLEAKE